MGSHRMEGLLIQDQEKLHPGGCQFIEGMHAKMYILFAEIILETDMKSTKSENFVSELEYLNKTYGVDVAMIADETPTFDRKRWEKILDLLIEKKLDVEILMETRVDDILRDKEIMYKYIGAGILHIYVGAESASQDTLNIYKKNLKIEESKEAID